MFDISDLDSLGDLAKQMKDIYSSGINAMNQAGEQVADNMKPDHLIKVHIKLKAKISGHDYQVDTNLVFAIEIKPVIESLNSSEGNLGALLDNLDVDLGKDKQAVMEQLGQPRAVGIVKKIKTSKLVVANNEGKVNVDLNKKATILATIKDNQVMFNFEGVFTYPDHPDLYIAIPSMEKMQRNIIVKLKDLTSKIEFSWVEKDKDNLKVSGDLIIEPL